LLCFVPEHILTWAQYCLFLQASRRAAVAEQNTIDSEARCVNALTKALAAEKAAVESRAQVLQLREAIADMQAADGRAQNEATVLQDLTVMLKNKLNAATEAQGELQVKLTESSREVEHVKTLLQEARVRERGIEERARAEHQDAQDRLERLVQEKAALEKTAKMSQSELQASVTRLTAQCVEVQAQLDAALQQFATEQARWIGEHHALLAQTESQLAADRAVREALEAQCADLRDQVARLSVSATTCRESLESQLLAVHVRSESTVLEVRAEQERQVATLRNKLLQQEHAFAGQLEAKVAEFADASAKQVAVHQTAVAKLEASHAEAMSSMQQHYKLLVDELASERERVEEQLESAQAECSVLRDASSKLKLEMESSAAQVVALSSALEESKGKITFLQNELKDVRSELSARLAELTSQLTGEGAQITALQEQIRDKEAQLVKAQAALLAQEGALREEASLGQLLEAKVKQVRI
jgi:chromosome segregation ATPase